MFEIVVRKGVVSVCYFKPSRKGRKYLAEHRYDYTDRGSLKSMVQNGHSEIAFARDWAKQGRRELSEYTADGGEV